MYAHTATVDRAQLIPSGTDAHATTTSAVRMVFTPGATDAGRGKLLFLRSGCCGHGDALRGLGLRGGVVRCGSALRNALSLEA